MKHISETRPAHPGFLLANSLVVCHRLVTYHKLYNSQHKVHPLAGPSCTSPPQTIHICTSASLQRVGADRESLCSHWTPSVAVKYSYSWGQHVAPQMSNPAWTCQRGREPREPGGRRHFPASSSPKHQMMSWLVSHLFLSSGPQTHIESVLAFFICATPH